MAPPKPGEVFEGLEIVGVLGQGGFATVFDARRLSDGLRVALKTLTFDRQSEYSPDTRARFGREVAILAALQAPHTVRLLQHGQSQDGTLYLVFEHLGGQDLSDMLDARGRLEPVEIFAILGQVLTSLTEAHDRGLLHRDIKPQNIRVTSVANGSPNVKLLDFGIARSTDQSHPAITATGVLIGTPRYMSPEQLTSQPLTPASDIYSLGMVAFELVMGPQALAGNNIFAQIERMQTGHLFSVQEIERVDPGLMAIIQRMTARRPEDRFASARAVLHALGQLRGGPTPVEPQASSGPSVSRWQLGAGLSILTMIVAGVVYGSVSSNSPPSVPPPSYRQTRIVKSDVNPVAKGEPVELSARTADTGLALDAGAAVEPVGGCGGTANPRRIGVLEGDVSHLPAAYDPNHRYPLVVLLHDDLGQRPQTFLREAGFKWLAEAGEFVVIAIRADRWDFKGREKDLQDLRDAINATATAVCIDTSRVFVVAQGNGGRTALLASCSRFVTAVATSSYIPHAFATKERYWCDTPTPAMVIVQPKSQIWRTDGKKHPPCSQNEPMRYDEYRRGWAKRNECTKPAPITIPGGKCDKWKCPKAPLLTCTTEGQAGWPGTGRVDKLMCPEMPSRHDISEQTWRFFQAAPPLPSTAD